MTCKVLWDGNHALTLKSIDPCHAHATHKIGRLTIRFFRSSPSDVSDNIKHRRPGSAKMCGFGFNRGLLTNLVDQVGIKGRRHGDSLGEDRGSRGIRLAV